MKFKVVCLNLWFGGKLFDEIFDFLDKERPDILACQEVYNGQGADLERRLRSFEELKTKFGYEHAFFSPAFLDNMDEGKIEQGNAIFSRFPIIGQNTTFYDIPYGERSTLNLANGLESPVYVPRNLQEALLKIGDKQIGFFNTQGIWGQDGLDNERRLKMGQIIIDKVKDKENIILTGDFNVNYGTKTISGVEKYLKNVFGGELVSSFNMKRKDNPGYSAAVVDMIFVSKNIKIIEHYCPLADVSDHLPLVSILELS